MSILDSKSKKMLVESMRGCVKNILKESAVLTAKQATDKSKFISEKATYEQLLNITMNPLRESKYLPDYVLEGAVAILHRACLTGRKHIGVNAITEGALKLHKETGAVITESMLDAALKSVEDGCGLKVISGILKESKTLMEAGLGGLSGLIPGLNLATRSFDSAALSNELNNLARTGLISGDRATFIYNDINRAVRSGDSAALRKVFKNNADVLRRVANRRLNSTPASTLSPFAAQQLQRHTKAFGKKAVTRSIPNPALTNPDLSAMANKMSKGGSGWKTAGLVAGGAALAGLGAMAYNKFKGNQQQAQQQ